MQRRADWMLSYELTKAGVIATQLESARAILWTLYAVDVAFATFGAQFPSIQLWSLLKLFGFVLLAGAPLFGWLNTAHSPRVPMPDWSQDEALLLGKVMGANSTNLRALDSRRQLERSVGLATLLGLSAFMASAALGVVHL
jgi:hypothetical protein